MKGIDVIDAMSHIDDDLIVDAKQPRRSAPRWIRTVSLAACLCCTILACSAAVHLCSV